MIGVKKEKILVKPGNVIPSSKLFEVIGTINPAVVRLPNGDIVMYVRVVERLKKHEDKKYHYSPRFAGEKSFKIVLDKFRKEDAVHSSDLDFSFADGTKRLKFISHLRRIVLEPNGFRVKTMEQRPSFYGLSWDGELGVEDPRIVKIGDLYVMTYVGLSRNSNVSTNLAVSNDCKKWYRKGIIFAEQNKDVVIFPERINHNYISFNRPEGNFEFSSPHIWISYSDNLETWGRSSSFRLAKKGAWDSSRVGAGPPPIKLKEGWLFIYHGVTKKIVKGREGSKRKKYRYVYSAGVALLDANNPKKIIAKSRRPIISPSMQEEKGTFENKDVFFPTGMVLSSSGRELLIYAGGGDVVTTARAVSVEGVLGVLRRV